MYARIATTQIQPGKMEEFIKIFAEVQRPILEQEQGFQSVRLLTDRSTNNTVAVGIWATESDAKVSLATGKTLEDLLKRFEGVLDGPPTIEHYEVSVGS